MNDELTLRIAALEANAKNASAMGFALTLGLQALAYTHPNPKRAFEHYMGLQDQIADLAPPAAIAEYRFALQRVRDALASAAASPTSGDQAQG